MTTALLVAVFVAVPVLVLWLVHRAGWAAKLGPIVLCYAAGLLAGNLGLLPAAAAPVQKLLTEVTVALALPMLLFTVDLRAWSRIAGRALLSMALAVAAVVVVACALFVVFRAQGQPAPHELAGLAVGVYTGGTPNLAAIKTALGVDDTRFVVFNAFDTVIGALYLLFMLTLAPRLAARWLRPAVGADAMAGRPAPAAVPAVHALPSVPDDDDYRALLTRAGLRGAAASLGLAALVVAAAVGLGQAFGGTQPTALVVALLATFGLLASLSPRVRGLAYSYRSGMFLIYVFSFAVASMARLDALQWADLALLGFVAAAVFGSLALHALLARLARIDAGTFVVTSVAAICSPAFVPLVARSLGSRELLASGIGTGIIGYAVGTQLGIAVALALAPG
jgi:uncharacterized membrane protein